MAGELTRNATFGIYNPQVNDEIKPKKDKNSEH